MDSLKSLDYEIFEELMSEPNSHVDHFTSSDRERIVELTVEMRHLKGSLLDMRRMLQDSSTDSQRDAKLLDARIALLESRWRWVMTAASAAAGAGGLLATLLFKKLFGV